MPSSDPPTSDPRAEHVVGLVDFAGRVLYAGDTLRSAGTAIGGADPGEQAFATDSPGGLGELCRHLHRQWHAALQARLREATDQGDRLVATAEALARVAAGYADTDVTLATEIARAEEPRPEGVRPPARRLTVRPDQEPR